MKRIFKAGILEFATVLGSVSAPALAQVDASSDRIADIVVTAQKRAESVQDVPIAISAFSGAALTERAIGNVAQLSAGTPNVNLDAGSTFSGSTAVLTAYIRGIGLNDFGIQLDPGVGVYLDGIYLARTIGANLDLPDVERIEILKGPQGTLFGRNTIGGAISVVTRDPGGQLAFRGDVTTGRFQRLDVRGSVDLPLTEQLSAMVTFSTKNRDGYQKRIPFPGLAQYHTEAISAFRNTGYDAADTSGDQDEWTLRGKLIWRPSSRMTVRLSADHQLINQSANPSSVLGVTDILRGPFAGTMNIPGTALDPTGTTGFNFGGLYNFCIGAMPVEIAARGAGNLCGPRGTPRNPSEILPGLGSVNVDGDPANNRLPFDSRWVNADKDSSYATGINFSQLKSWGLAGTSDYELSDNVNLRSITGYRDIDFKSGVDFDNSPLAILENSISARQWQFSQEFQILGKALDKKVTYVLGGYFFKEKGSAVDYITFGQGLLQIDTPVDIKTTNYAVFGQADWRITDLIGVTVGGRYTHEKKILRASISDLNGLNYKLFNCTIYGDPCSSALGFPDPSDPLEFYVQETQHKKFSNFSPKVGIQLHPLARLIHQKCPEGLAGVA
jgi:outer membrane receptor protein involved in Fe transport